MKAPDIYVNHLGFLCRSAKRFVMDDTLDATGFEIQDMGIPTSESLGAFEDWQPVFRGTLERTITEMGTFLTGDFSALEKPGVYRIVVKTCDARSYQFVISDGVYSKLPRYFLDFIHDRRSGRFTDDLRTYSHLDDGILSGSGEWADTVGGWYDAGDLRKWMTMSNLPAVGFADMYGHGHFRWNHFAEEGIADNDWITEIRWVVPYLLKMRNREGMFYEGTGLGGTARKLPGMSWWYENHSGCYGDNSDNRFTDNAPGSGDERRVRTAYNPMVQYITQYILMRAASVLRSYDTCLADEAVAAACLSWEYTQKHPEDEEQACRLTATLSWCLLAALELHKACCIPAGRLEEALSDLMSLQDDTHGFWYYDKTRRTPYRGIQHSAQPLIALCRYGLEWPDAPECAAIKAAVKLHWEKYIRLLLQTSPFAIVPYGCWFEPPTQGDLYRQISNGLYFRFFMPDCSEQKINHGLSGHWTSWAHGLSLASLLLGDFRLRDAAWAQLYWLWGGNPKNSCLVSGVGYNNPMPHSRFHGTMVGGFCVGPRGNAADEIVIDLDRRGEWNSTEYWNCPAANALMAFSILLPKDISEDNKIGSPAASAGASV